MLMPVMKNMTKSILYKNCILFYDHLQLRYKTCPFHQCFHYILQLTYYLVLYYIYNFCSLNILLCHMIYHIPNDIY